LNGAIRVPSPGVWKARPMAGLQRGIQTHQGDYRKRLQPEPGVGLEPTTFSLQEKIAPIR